MKILIAYLLVFVPSLSIGQINSDTTLYWGNRRLVWSDFKGSPPDTATRGRDIARTKSLISSHYERVGDTIRFEVLCQFFVMKSWTVTNSLYSLNHEQKHFDIAEVSAREIRRYYSNLFRMQSSKLVIRRNIDSLNTAGLALQELYDKETNYGRDRAQQAKWDKTIEKMLESLAAYRQPKGAVVFKR